MVQGLGFLSKKSWHTKNLSNQEKVWMAEQQKEAEGRKTKELARQIQQEREQEELDKISGKKTTKDRGIDWMYQHGPNSESAKEYEAKRNEEFLLGKEYAADGATSGDFDNGDIKEGIFNVLENSTEEQEAPTQESAYYNQEPSVKDRNEQFRMRVEDPMFHVQKQQNEKNVQHEKTKALYKRVVGHQDSEDDDDYSRDEKTRKRDRKRHKKSHRKRERKSSSSRKRRSRSSSSERHHRSRKHRSSRRRDRSRSRSRSGERYSSRREEQSSNNPCFRRDRHSLGEERHSRRRSDEHDDRRYHDESKNDRKQEGYGLKGAVSVDNVTIADLGPNKEFLQRKRQEREDQRRRVQQAAASRSRQSGEERAQAIAKMQMDARRHEDSRHYARNRGKEDVTVPPDNRKGASFLADMAKQTHGITGNSSASLSERLRQNRHTNQRTHESFL